LAPHADALEQIANPRDFQAQAAIAQDGLAAKSR